MLPPDLDPALPAAERALDPAEVVAHFARGRRSGTAPAVDHCELEYLRWWPGSELIATYRLAAGGGEFLRVVSVTPHGASHRPYDEDPVLTGIAPASDPGTIGAWLSRQLGGRVEVQRVTPVRYRPSRRCVLRYDVRAGAEQMQLYGKLVPGDRAARLTAALRALGGSFSPPLVGWAPEWQLVVQADGGRSSLRSVARGRAEPADLDDVRRAAELLARLHAREGVEAPPRTLGEDSDELRQYLPACERVAPEVADRFLGCIERLQSHAAAAGSPSAGHGAFGLDQVHLTSSGPLFIDLDAYCRSEPERDLANLGANLRWRAMRHPELRAPLQRIQVAFRTAYSAAAARPLDAGRQRLYEAVSLLKVAGRRYQRLKVREWGRVPELVEPAWALLEPAA